MIDAPGVITSLDGDYAVVRMDETGCGRCHEQGGCGGNNLGKMFCSTPRVFRVLNPGDSSIGDRVNVVIAEGTVRRSATLAYGLPLLFLFAGAISGSLLAGDPGAIIGAVCGLCFAWAKLRYAQQSSPDDPRFRPYIRY